MEAPKCKICGEKHWSPVCSAFEAKADASRASREPNRVIEGLKHAISQHWGHESPAILHKRSGRPKSVDANAAQKPWLFEKPPISERTWYRRQKKASKP